MLASRTARSGSVRIREQVEYCQRHHETIDNVPPAVRYCGRNRLILKKRNTALRETMKMRGEVIRMVMLEALPNSVS